MNLLVDLCRCSDADEEYIRKHTALMSSCRPGIKQVFGSGLPTSSGIKTIAASLIGVRGVCFILGKKKHPS